MKKLDPGSITTPYRDTNVTLKKITKFSIKLEILKVNAWKYITHHPVCSVYENHYFKIGKLKLCVGCTSIYTNMLVEFILYLIFKEFFLSHLYVFIIIGYIGLTAAIVHVYTNPEKKWLKTLLRSLLGWALAAYLIIILIINKLLIQLALYLVLMILVALYTLIKRKKGLDYCSICPLSTAEPPCQPIINTAIKTEKLNKMLEEIKSEKRKKIKKKK